MGFVKAATEASPAQGVPASKDAGAPSADTLQEKRWPRKLSIRKAISFPVSYNDRVVGQVELPAGSELEVVGVNGADVLVLLVGTVGKVPLEMTDLKERMESLSTERALSGPGKGFFVPPMDAEEAGAKADTANLQEPKGTMALLLSRAGENREELERALVRAGKMGKEERLAVEVLLSHAQQFDLVNLTANHLLHTVEYAAKARKEMPWAPAVPREVWTEYVLPYRVADEDLDDWRPEFYEELAPLVKPLRDSKTAAVAVHQWLYKGANGAARIEFMVSESRDQTPRQLLHQTKIGRCFEMNLLLVALLRAVGVPARHAGVAYWTRSQQYHYWVEYWDTGSRKWLALEPNADPDQVAARKLPFAVAYGFPGLCTVSDPVARERWDVMTNVSASYAKTGTLEVRASGALPGKTVTYTVYNWNCGAWRSVATLRTSDRAVFELAENPLQYPYLVSAGMNGKAAWEWVRVSSGTRETVSLRPGFPSGDPMIAEFKVKPEKATTRKGGR